MDLSKNKKGVTATAIILLGLLALSVVLLDGTAIALGNKNKKKTDQGKKVAISYCTKANPAFPAECRVSRVYKCDDIFILRTGCSGVGDVIINSTGEFVSWCGYTALGEETAECGKYWLDAKGFDCTQTNNLCL